jgi:hypothetical protein
VDDRQSTYFTKLGGKKPCLHASFFVPIFLKKKFKKKIPHSNVFRKKGRWRILAMTVVATRFFDKSFVFFRQD